MSLDQVPMPPFKELLKQHRLAARLTQQELAERAQMSEHSISNLERGARHAPRKETVHLLAAALGLTAQEDVLFSASAEALRRPRASAVMPLGALALPHPITPLIGRDNEVRAISSLLQTGQIRLLTLTGMGGVGKTHLAQEVLRQLNSPFGIGRAFVDLSYISSPELVIPTIARALAIRESGSQSLLESIQAQLQQDWLLVVDNFEHLLPAAPHVAELLALCPSLHILVTSRSALHLRGEHLQTIHPLPYPDVTQEVSPAALMAVPAVALFVARAQALDPTFALTSANATTISAICRRLEGLPLAIELAAPRLILLSLEVLLARLDHRLALLTQGAQDLPARQRTLRATLAWSYDLLPTEEQALFRRLAVFAGEASMAAIEAICQPHADTVVDSLTALLTHHLVHTTGKEQGEPRVRMLEMVREYASEHLVASGEQEATQRKHAAYYLALAERAEPELKGPQQVEWQNRLDEEYENLCAVLRWTLDEQESEVGLRLSGALWRFWYQRGLLSEGRAWLEQLLALPTSDAHMLWRAKAFHGAGWLAFGQGDFPHAQAYHTASLELSRILGNQSGIAQSLNNLGGIARMESDYPRATQLFEESLALYRVIGDPSGISSLLNNLAATAWEQGKYVRAQVLGEESLALHRATGNLTGVALTMEGLGILAADQGDYVRAQAWLEECLRLSRTLGESRRIARVLRNLGDTLLAQKDIARARVLYTEGQILAQQVEDTICSAEIWQSLGHLALAEGNVHQAQQHFRKSLTLHYQRGARREMAKCLEGLVETWTSRKTTADAPILIIAARLAAAAEMLRKTTGTGVAAPERAKIEQQQATLHVLLDPTTFEAAWSAGATMPIEAIVAEALTLNGC